MSEKPKRKFWQIHLSTAIILMLLAGAFVGILTWYANAPISVDSHGQDWTESDRHSTAIQEMASRGFIITVLAPVAIILFLTAVAIGCEWLIRRREGRKP